VVRARHPRLTRDRGEASGVWTGREDALAAEVLSFCRLMLDSGLALDPTDESR
jgi:hypothetical protein